MSEKQHPLFAIENQKEEKPILSQQQKTNHRVALDHKRWLIFYQKSNQQMESVCMVFFQNTYVPVLSIEFQSIPNIAFLTHLDKKLERAQR